MNSKIRKIPRGVKWIISILFAAAGFYISILILSLISFPLNIGLIPIVKPIGHFSLVPFLRLSGVLKYYSPMLIAIKRKNKFELHNGTTFDYILFMSLKQKGRKAQLLIIKYYLEGLINLINSIAKEQNKNEIVIEGVSYFFSEKTAQRLGFEVKRASMLRKFLFIIDYINLFVMYSYSKNRAAFPKLKRLKKARITGKNLLDSKSKFVEILNTLNTKYEMRIDAR